MTRVLAILIWIMVPAAALAAPPDRPCPADWECLSPTAVARLLAADEAAEARFEADRTLLRREAAAELEAERRTGEVRAGVLRVELDVALGALQRVEGERDRRPSRLAAVLWGLGAGVVGLGAGVVVGVVVGR